MHTSIGKPLVALVSAACLTAPATIPTLQQPLSLVESHIAVQLSAAAGTLTPAPVDTATVQAAIDQVAALTGVDKGTLLLALLTAPYHNVLAVSNATGAAFEDVVMLLSLPLSVATLVLSNQTGTIPAYIASVHSKLAGALPGIKTAIQTEIAYDVNLFKQLFGSNVPNSTAAAQMIAVDSVAATPITRATLFTQLLTAPYHNVLAIANATGSAVEAVGLALSLPLSIATLVLANQPEKIPAYVTTVQTNLKNAIPGIKKAITTEIAYDKNVISQLFGGTTTTDTAATAAAPSAGARQTADLPSTRTRTLSVSVPSAVTTPTATSGTTTATEDTATEDTATKDTSTTGTANVDAKRPAWAHKLAEKTVATKAGPKTDTDTAGSDAKAEGSEEGSEKADTAGASEKAGSSKPAASSSTAHSTGGKHRKADAA
ncbi:hypothetical protein Mycch_2617 [Mycolicibacterium chubuense NBB4]|uniref:PPE family protein PPE42 n=1 Tax=Mycolicibacterium chubuense (strain NBB4) TaxID=710421 RepID=I4BJD2_MYCCN|nr:hypothetical protein [Mycolicibacterium chubuense]AFM17389.1 hypothetical protein Mycch_2617 [Mycolicibacterium chubuense NBB4]